MLHTRPSKKPEHHVAMIGTPKSAAKNIIRITLPMITKTFFIVNFF